MTKHHENTQNTISNTQPINWVGITVFKAAPISKAANDNVPTTKEPAAASLMAAA